jgi:hypothetical protein
MSAYINFYMAVDGKIVPLYNFGRNTEMFDTANDYVPYEGCIELTNDIIRDMRKELREAEDSYHNTIKSIKDSMDRVAAFNNPIEEKIDMLDHFEREISDIEQSIEDVHYAESIINFLSEIMNTCQFSERKDRGYLKTVKILMGYECSMDTAEEFVKEKTQENE